MLHPKAYRWGVMQSHYKGDRASGICLGDEGANAHAPGDDAVLPLLC